METRKNNEEIERRFFETKVEFETRTEGESNTLIGYGAVFNSNSQDLGGFIERIEPGAFDEVLDDDVYGLLNHNTDKILGRNKVNMKLSADDKGLKYRIELPDTATAKEVRTLVKDGIIDKSSFAFQIKEQRWEHRRGELSIRTITKFKRLFDVSPVSGPAYLDTSVSVRSYQKEIENNKPYPQVSLREREFKLKHKLK